ncbi:MAG: hypothetical protein ABIL68_10000 [bacterium]
MRRPAPNLAVSQHPSVDPEGTVPSIFWDRETEARPWTPGYILAPIPLPLGN